MSQILFVSAIDTDAGKTVITGAIAKAFLDHGKQIITQKITQTGVEEGIAEDLLAHRQMMGIELQEVDYQGWTCPYTFKLPASPHLAAAEEGVEIDVQHIDHCTQELQKHYEYILLEGAGGLHVPLHGDFHLIDFIQERKYPLILVTTPKLGSINHTLLSLEVIKNRNIPLMGVVYNEFPNDNPIITEDSYQIFKSYLKKEFGEVPFVRVPKLTGNEHWEAIFSGFIQQQVSF